MTNPNLFLSACLLAVLCVAAGPATAQPFIEDETAAFTLDADEVEQFSAAQWREFGDRIEEALGHTNSGVRNAAMRALIQYGSQFTVNRPTVWSLTRAYRDGEDPNRRRMAVIALASTNDDWALDFLYRSLAHEQDPALRHTVAAVLFDAGMIGFGQARRSN